ncbi:hypothetical protein DFP72DRAFT_35962 [Ephemerocybe angulata]|uniref:SWIM-type domain-containing protein n=1 Tax=Ephemerocybe angulata TaxID=980116 RepID=A0A8H6I997_9AGAR|nr:hypothetical protein DFP72DRAFT_35962 [Tulosesus angulatus]
MPVDASQRGYNKELLSVALAIINSLEEELNDDSFSKLGAVFSQKMVIAALDLLDRGDVIKYVATWGKVDYEVLGSTSTYFVQLDLPSQIPFYCSCPAFSKAVLFAQTHIMCKHVLGTLLARKLSMAMERPISADELLEIFTKHYQ